MREMRIVGQDVGFAPPIRHQTDDEFDGDAGASTTG
jgi:hypothetical protein